MLKHIEHQKYMLKLMGEKIIQFYAENFCLSKPGLLYGEKKRKILVLIIYVENHILNLNDHLCIYSLG